MKLSHAFSYISKSPLAIMFGLAVATTITAGTFAAFGPDRPTYTWNGNDTHGADHVTFNSFVNHPSWGDERDFARGVVVGRDSNWTDPLHNIEGEQTVKVIMFVHNNADARLNASGEGIARDTRLAVDIPTSGATNQEIKGTISASNASPKNIYDTVSLSGNGNFELDYVEGSAHITGNHINKALSDDLVNGGVLLGDALDGNMKGCFDGSVFVTFEVKVKSPSYEISKAVREEGSGPGNWAENVKLDAGDTAEWEIRFANTGATHLKHVTIVDELPEGLTIVPGSMELINATNPSGIQIPDEAIQKNGRQINVQIGSYHPNSNAFVYFLTTVDAYDCDVTEALINKAFATPEGYGAIVDTARVTTNKVTCEQPSYEYECTALNLSILDKAERKVKAEAVITKSDNVKIVGTVINFGDDTTEATNPAIHTYAEDGTYNVEATVKFELQNEAKEVKEVRCSNEVTFEAEVEYCPIEGKTDLPKDDPNCKEDPKCEVPGLENLPKDDPNCKETPMCEVAGLENLEANDPNCKETEYCQIDGLTDLTADDPKCEEPEVKCEIAGLEALNADDPNCKETETKKCEIAGKTHLDADDADCKEVLGKQTPTTLPTTGAGSVLFTFFGATTAAAAAYGYVKERRNA